MTDNEDPIARKRGVQETASETEESGETKRQKTNEPNDKPGRLDDLTTFFNIDSSEDLVAGYCNFSDIYAFRCFYLSEFVLPFVLSARYYAAPRLEVLTQIVSNGLLDQKDMMSELPVSDLGRTDSGTDEEKEQERRSAYQFGLVIWQMLQGLQHATKLYSEGRTAEYEDLQAAWRDTGKRFEMDFGHEVPYEREQPLPAYDEYEGAFKRFMPDFGPFYGETELEPPNRCLTVLNYVNGFARTSEWKEQFEDQWGWNEATSINEECIPQWMQPSRYWDPANGVFDVVTNRKVRELKALEVTWDEGNLECRKLEEKFLSTYVDRAKEKEVNLAFKRLTEEMDVEDAVVKTEIEVFHHKDDIGMIQDRISMAFNLGSGVPGHIRSLYLVCELLGKAKESAFDVVKLDVDFFWLILRSPELVSARLSVGLELCKHDPWAIPPLTLTKFLKEQKEVD